jgi:hypothetical protein
VARYTSECEGKERGRERATIGRVTPQLGYSRHDTRAMLGDVIMKLDG